MARNGHFPTDRSEQTVCFCSTNSLTELINPDLIVVGYAGELGGDAWMFCHTLPEDTGPAGRLLPVRQRGWQRRRRNEFMRNQAAIARRSVQHRQHVIAGTRCQRMGAIEKKLRLPKCISVLPIRRPNHQREMT